MICTYDIVIKLYFDQKNSVCLNRVSRLAQGAWNNATFFAIPPNVRINNLDLTYNKMITKQLSYKFVNDFYSIFILFIT